MTRLKRFSFLVATLILVAQCVTATNIAVVLTDVKFDDKMAIHVLSHSGDFDEIFAVLSCVKDQDAAHADLLDFLSKMNKNKKLYGPGMLKSPPRLTVFKGDNLKEVTAPHEPTFLGTKVDSNLEYFNADSFNKHLELLYSSSAGQPLQKPTVEIFQIAPAHRTQVETLAAMDNIDITLFHLVHGYNSAQTKTNGYGGTESFDFVTQIGPIIHTKHPKAKIVFTQSAQTFLHKEGGIQPYAKLIDGPVPADHLEAALNDPFYARQFTLAVRVLDEAKLIIVINQLKRVAKLMMKFEYYRPLGRSLGTKEFPLVDLPKNVFRAGMQAAYKDGIAQEKLAKRQEEDAAIRNHYIKFIEDGISFLDKREATWPLTDEQEENERTLRNNLNTFVRDFLMGADPLISPYVKYMRGELTAKKLSDDQNWIAQMKNVAVVDEETEFDEYEDVRYYQNKAIVEDLDKDNYESDKNDWYDYNYKEIFTLLLRARKNLEGDISQKLRKNILDLTKAIGPIIFDFQPKIHNGLATRFEYVIPKAFLPDTALTVEVCDANHILVVRHAIKAAKILGVDKFQDIGLASDKNGQIIFKFEKVMMGESYVWHGKTLTGLRAADSFKLLEPYLLRKKNVRALRLVEAVPLTEEE